MQECLFPLYTSPDLHKRQTPERGSFLFMKWISTKPGNYKLVEDDDPRPEVHLPSKEGSPSIHIAPPWKKYESGITVGTPDAQNDMSDKFLAEREHAMKTDPSLKRWEESRKKSVLKDKPAWRKDRIRKIEQEKRSEVKKIVESL